MNLREFFTHYHWWGKLIGAFFGYLIGGPAGALFGILIGNFFDRGIIEHFTRPHWHYHKEKRKAVQKIFFQATFSVMGHIAKADGRVSEQEIEMAKTLMDEMRLGREQKTQAKRFFSEGKAANFDLGNIISLLQQVCHDNRELLKLFIDIQYRAAQSGGLSPEKILALNIVLGRLGFAPLHQQYRFYEDPGAYASQSSGRSYQNSSHKQSNYQTPSHTLAHAYAILEVDKNAGRQEVKRAYRRLISRNHPDRLIAQGLPEQMIKVANDKTQKIRKAYEQICASKGW
ncbi:MULTISPECIES: co-chaperone DjlA [unclassified Legionella]|uniref:co-chaperone DjlA n=1 Tax=unclassified Legionella TaxID=2622702 RepID=UPI001055984E|nr:MULTISPECIES: co-chaperone DjlA [unclassified Legionella]MDI9819084.1 co-chaperone DjlA [Legionella sp. PL877]